MTKNQAVSVDIAPFMPSHTPLTEYRDSNRLEDGPLLVLGPTTNAAPDGRENAGKTGQAAKNPVQKADACICRHAAALTAFITGRARLYVL